MSGKSRRQHFFDAKLFDSIIQVERLAHEWDKRSQSLKSLHLHAHRHEAKSDDLKTDIDALAPEQRHALTEAFPEIKQALDTPQVIDTTPDPNDF